MYSLSIKSSIRNYEVFFRKSILESLEAELKPEDVIFIDKNVFAHLHKDVQQLIKTNNHILNRVLLAYIAVHTGR